MQKTLKEQVRNSLCQNIPNRVFEGQDIEHNMSFNPEYVLTKSLADQEADQEVEHTATQQFEGYDSERIPAQQCEEHETTDIPEQV